jgi:hypothetical protein
MSNNPNHGTQPNIPEPLYTQEQAFVENVFADPLSASMPDVGSQAVMADYLIDRTRNTGPKEQIHVVMTPSGVSLPKLTHEVVGTRQINGWQKTQEWLIKPKWAVGVWIGSWALLNVVSLGGDIADEARQGGYETASLLGLLPEDKTETHTEQVPAWSTPKAVRQHIAAGNDPGSAEVNPGMVLAFKHEVQDVSKKGAKTTVKVTALSSDDYGSDASLGVKEPTWQDMSDERAQAWSEAIGKAMPNATVEAKTHQDVLTASQLRRLSRLAERAGFTGENALIDAVTAAQAGQGPNKLRAFVAKNFIMQRGVNLEATVQNPKVETSKEITVEEVIPADNQPPADPNRDYKPWFVPLPWLRRRRWVDLGERDIKRWKFIPGKQLLRPEIFKQTLDQAWLRIRPEAVQADQTLVNDAWAYTRKYEHLVRDDRIAEVLRADYKDAKGQDASLRIMFVDKKPDDLTVEAYSKLLTSLAAMRTQDGRTIADTVTGMFVFPEEHSGKQRNPKKIGVGIDNQYALDTMGVMYYPLKLVELHMPTDLSGDALQQYLDNYRGAIFTLAHEAAGHGTDVSDEQLKVRRIYSPNISNAHVIDGDPRAEKMSGLQDSLRPLMNPTHGPEATEPRMFDVSFPVVDKNGNTFVMEPRVAEHDPQLKHAHKATIVGREPTQYSSESATEHYAETAAATATGITIDFDEAHVHVPEIIQNGVTANFATGYHPDARTQELYAAAVGGVAGSLPLAFASAPEVSIVRTSPEDDPVIRAHMIRARQLRAPKPNELIALLASTSRRQK